MKSLLFGEILLSLHTELLAAVNEFAEIFWEIKGIKTKIVTAPYAPSESVVSPIL